MAVASVASTALYFYNYAFGFTVLLALSLVHVVLEFPLNNLALRQLGAAIRPRCCETPAESYDEQRNYPACLSLFGRGEDTGQTGRQCEAYLFLTREEPT